MLNLRKWFADETSNGFVQFFRYIFVGGAAFVVDYALLYALTEWAGLHYLVSATISFLAGLAVNYALSTWWIFRDSKLQNKWAEFLVFAIIGVIGLALNNLLLYAFTDWAGVHYMVSKLLTAALVMLWNFLARKYILFTKK